MRDKIIIKTSIIGIVSNIFLATFKAIVGLLSNSIAIILDAVNNLTDCLSSIVTIVGTKLSSMEPDKKHPYGYGRIEYFSSIIISLIIIGAGIASFKESIVKIIHIEKATYEWYTFLLIVVAIIFKYLLSFYYKKIGNKVNSTSLVASGEDAFNDAIISISTLIGAIVSIGFGISIEGFIGILISFFILKTGYEIIKESASMILGSRADQDLTDKLRKRINKFKEVQGVYDLNIHSYGPQKIFATANIQVRNSLTAEDIHILTRKIEYYISSEFGIILTLGVSAANDEGEFGEIKKDLNKIINKYKSVIQLHGFYVDKKNMNIYFDIIIDFEEKDKAAIKDKITEEIKSIYPEYNYYIIIDSDFAE